MDDVSSLRDTITPKSDRINADDFMAGPMTVRVVGVTRGDADTPVCVGLDGMKPWYPCKSMRRVLIAAWGDDGRQWAGRQCTLYTEPEVKFGGVKVGGIRVSHMSHIKSDMALALTATRGKRMPFIVKPIPMYPADKFGSALAVMRKQIADKKMTAEQVIAKCEQTGLLTDEQKTQITQPAQEQKA
jgi:hypothetical protein